jgi:hypothetical protein
MPSESFEVDTEGLAKQMPYMRELAARFKAIGTTLGERTAALGEPWGDDETGRQFLEQYDGPHRQILDGIGQVGDVLNSTADGITTMAKNYRILEEQNVEAARTLTTGGGSTEEHGAPRSSERP